MLNDGRVVSGGVSSFALALALLLGTQQHAHAQTASATQQDGAEADSPAAAEEIVVTGFRKSYADALKMKRQADGVTDSISADSLGRFPDLNVGEALQRVPGVQINREAASRDATINLRGLPGTYVRYTINGQAYADPLLDGSTPLGAFNADVFSAITIIKTPAAGDQAGGLSGIVDLRIAPALSRTDGGFAKVAGEYNTLGHYGSPAFTLGYNKHLSDDFALFGVVAFKKEKFRRDSIYLNAYSPLNAATTPNFAQYAEYYSPFAANGSCPSGKVCAAGGTGTKGTTGVRFASDQRQAVKYNEGTLWTAAGGAEWRPDERLHLSLGGFYTRRNLSKNLTNLIEVDLRGARSVIAPTDAPRALVDGNAYVQTYSYSTAQLNDSIRSEPMLQQAWNVIGTADWQSDDWHLTGTVVKSRGENNALQTQIDVRNLPTAAGNGINGSFASGGSNIGGYRLTVDRTPALVVPSGPWSWSPGNQPTQIAANGDQLVVAGSSGYGLNKVGAGQFDVERTLDLPFLKSINAGGRYEEDRFISRGYRTSAKGVRTQNIDASFLGDNPYAGSFFGGSVPGVLTNWPQVNFDRAVAALQPVTAAPGDVITPTGWINDPTNASYALYNFTVRNDIWSVYGQVKFGFTLGSVPVHGNAGLHYEETRQRIDTQNRQVGPGGAITYVPQQFRQTYHNALPSVIVVADLTNRLVLRGAYYEAFVRPQPRNLTPATTVSANSSGYAIAYGGFDLKPYSATAQDLSIEWYNRPGSAIALALYRKRITNLIGPESRLDKLCPADASAFGLGQLSLIGTTCFSSVLVNGQPAIVTATGNYNQPNPITVKGLEFSVQQNFDFLPGMLKNLGGQFNYSYTDISGKNPDGSAAVLPGVSKNNINLIGYYETKKFGVRATYSWRDEYVLTGGSTFTGGQSLVAARGQLDASTSFNFTDRYSISLDLYNLTNAKRIQYQVTPDIPRQADYDGRTFTLSLHGTF
ncbi:TonB-dependent receptor [Sphingomonas elodea]|uniref:TonB-dependent receptor n=1 Tax=Sphingomonas elodea TaxID=179878 RepID=UPI0002630837|nr:TonB-dependent receptor [Sphingomonas elodea]